MDPRLNLIRLLQPRATLWGSIRASGRWSLSFPDRHDLIFFRVDRGHCMLLCGNADPLSLVPNDVVLVRTSVPVIVASDTDTTPVDSWSLIASTRSRKMHVGDGRRTSVVVHGGRFVFDAADEDLLLSLLPNLMHVVPEQASSDRIRSLLTMNEAESAAPGPGSEFIVGRLVELLLIELLRSINNDPALAHSGLLAGLADPVIARALNALHQNIARAWTTAKLARECGVSRSALSKRFSDVVGVAPITYLQRWRVAVAKGELRRGVRSLSEIAGLVGFQSSSAFSAAFTRHVGCPPSRYAASPAASA